MAMGAAFAIVGLVDLTLLWTPLRFGSPGWEFATLSQTFSNVPLTGLGLVLVAYGLVNHPRRGGRWMWVGAIFFAILTLLLVGMGVLYATVVPAVLRETPIESVNAVSQVIAKNGAEIVVYPVVFGFIAFVLWRSVERDELN